MEAATQPTGCGSRPASLILERLVTLPLPLKVYKGPGCLLSVG
jgi:hypothetical protein